MECSSILIVKLIAANTGGLLGLFMGFSVVSIVELIYFMTFRPYCTQQRIDDGEQFYPNEIFTATPILTKPRKRTFGDRIRRLTSKIHRKFKAVFSSKETNRREFYPYIDWTNLRRVFYATHIQYPPTAHPFTIFYLLHFDFVSQE